jgi:hypothetical protein
VLLALGFLGPETDTAISQLGCEPTDRGNVKASADRDGDFFLTARESGRTRCSLTDDAHHDRSGSGGSSMTVRPVRKLARNAAIPLALNLFMCAVFGNVAIATTFSVA